MSNALPPSVQPTGRSRKLTFVDDIDSKYLDYRYQSYRQPSPYTSSPPRSSSPPRTPATSSKAHNSAHIRSSPDFGLDYGFPRVADSLVDPTTWDRRYTGTSSSLYYPAPRYASSIKSSQPPQSDYYTSSNYAISLLSEDVEQDLPELDSEPASEGTPGHSSGVFSESEEETEDDDDSTLFSSDGYRSTFFRTSAERGQWKSDPVSAFKLTQQPLLQTRRSAPTQSRVTTPTLNKPRLVSEPAVNPSPLALDTTLKVTQDRPDRTLDIVATPEIPSPSEISPQSCQDGVNSLDTMPSLVSDRASSPELEYLDGPLSPLPPSSPPLSPISYGRAHSRSMSVASLSEIEDPESPFMRSSSPLSELSDDDDDDFQLGGTTNTEVSIPLPMDNDQTPVKSDRASISEATTTDMSQLVPLTTESNSEAGVGHQIQAVSKREETNLGSGSIATTSTNSRHDSVGDMIGNIVGQESRPSVELGQLSPSSSSLSSHPRTNTSNTSPVESVSSPDNAITHPTPVSQSTIASTRGDLLCVKEGVVSADKNGMNFTVGHSRAAEDSCEPVASTSTSSSATSPVELLNRTPLSASLLVLHEDTDERAKVGGESEGRQVSQKRKQTQSVNGDTEVGIDGPVKKRKVVGDDDTSLLNKGSGDEVKSKGKATTSKRISGEAKEDVKGKSKDADGSGEGKTSLLLSTTGNEKPVEAEEGEEESMAAPKARKRKRAEEEVDETTLSGCGSGAKRTAKATRARGRGRKNQARSDQENQRPVVEDLTPLDDVMKAVHVQVFGLLIETMAMSRASSLPVSSLYKMMMQSQPGMKEQRSRDEWCRIFDRVLKSGEAGRGSGVFGKVESSGKDDSDRPLESQWFYVPELDEDQERATVIRSMMPRPAKRSETKKYKQYYWRPLDKISKWDPEDEL